MTAELARAGYQSTPPFHGDTCEVKHLSLDQLWHCYKVAVSLVTGTSNFETYRSAQDWHLHDGFITDSSELSAAHWAAWLDSPQSLRKAWEAEDWCHRTVYPQNMAWCLRFICWEENSERPLSKHANDFALDLSGDPSLVKEFADRIRELYRVEPQVNASSDWFIESGHTDMTPKNLSQYDIPSL